MKSLKENVDRIRKMISGLYWLAAFAFTIWIIKLIGGFFLNSSVDMGMPSF